MQEYDMININDYNDGKRGADALMLTLEKCQKIISKNVELEKNLSVTSKNLAFAKLSLRYIIDCCKDSDVNNLEFYIKRICKKAEDTLRKIKEKNHE